MSNEPKPQTSEAIFLRTSTIVLGVFLLLAFLGSGRGEFDDNQFGRVLVLGLLFAGAAGAIHAYRYKGAALDRTTEDPKSLMVAIGERIAQKGYAYSKEHTWASEQQAGEQVHVFNPPWIHWVGGRVYVWKEESRVHVVGPQFILKELRDV